VLQNALNLFYANMAKGGKALMRFLEAAPIFRKLRDKKKSLDLSQGDRKKKSFSVREGVSYKKRRTCTLIDEPTSNPGTPGYSKENQRTSSWKTEQKTGLLAFYSHA